VEQIRNLGGWRLKPVFEWVRVTRISSVAERTFVIAFNEPKSAAAIGPGQFCMISPCPGSSNVFLPRPFSYYRVADDHTIEILFRTFGRATRWMAGLAPGDRIGVVGPRGNTFNQQPGAERVILAGGGIGLPPIVFLAESLSRLANAPQIDLIYGELGGARVVDLEKVVPSQVRCHITTEDGTVGAKGLVNGQLSRILDTCHSPPAVYTCGPRAMMAAVAGMLDPEKVALFETSCEENMACGRGICQGCAIPLRGEQDSTRYVCCCTEGPVFNGFEVEWD